MRSLLIMAAVVTAAMALAGCPYHRPAPGPQSSNALGLGFGQSGRGEIRHAVAAAPAPAEINWFQGTLDEAFSRRPCPDDHPQLRY